MRPEDVRVVIPTYDERETIAHVVAAVRLSGYSLLIVDDGSPDGTGDIVSEIAEHDSQVTVMRRTQKNGLGRAYGAGFAAALADSPAAVVQMDADLSHNPADIPRLVSALEAGADLAIGSRYVSGGSTPDWPFNRKMISRGGNLYVRMMLGLPIRDATAGFRAFRPQALARLPYATAQASGYAFQIEMTRAAVAARLNITEVPIVFRDRELGSSKMTSDIVVEAMKLVTRWGFARLGFSRADATDDTGRS